MNRFSAKGWPIARVISALALLFCVRAQAHVFVVTDTNDTTSVTSLRGAVIAANADGGENTIILGEEFDPRRHGPAPEWTFYLTIQGTGEDAAQTGDLDVTAGRLTIIGATTKVTIDATALGDRLFHVWPDAGLNLENLTITGGGKPHLQPIAPPISMPIAPIAPPLPIPIEPIAPIAPTNPITIGPTEPIVPLNPITISPLIKASNSRSAVTNSTVSLDGGGGVLNAGLLVMENCTVSNNTAVNDSGGGILNTGSLELFHCNVCGNFAAIGNGGAIYNVGRMTLRSCVISSNILIAPSAEGGGGICNDASGTVELNECLITGNFSEGDGGGLFNAGSLTLNNCLLSRNSCGFGTVVFPAAGDFGGSGGGISSVGELTMNNCTISENAAGTAFGPNSAGGNGGGINNLGNLFMRFCTVSSNTAGSVSSADIIILTNGVAGTGGNGGGIFNSGGLLLNTCTISGNACGNGGNGGNDATVSGTNGGAGGCGGGIYSSGSLSSSSSTIVLNLAGAGGNGGNGLNTNYIPNSPGPASGGQGGNGGGVCIALGNAEFENTLVALNMVGAGGAGGMNLSGPGGEEPFPGLHQIYPPGPAGLPGVGPDGYGALVSEGFNLIGAADGSTGLTNGLLADQVGTVATPIDPVIGPLQMNGGPTETHALLPGSPAINKGFCFGIHRDQRGEHRPFEYPGVPYAAGGDGSDIGAFELHLNECFGQRREGFDKR